MRGRRRQLYTLILTGAVLLSSCGQTVQVAPTPTPTPASSAAPVERYPFALPYSPTGSLHPIDGSNRVNLVLAPLVYQGLFALDREFGVREDLCESYEVSENGLTWSFALKSVTFSDGSPLTVAEAVASLNRARRSTRFSGRLSGIRTVTAIDDRVVVTLSSPNGALPLLLDVPIVKETGEGWPLGTGNYVPEKLDGEMRLVAREGVKTGLPTILLRPVTDGDDLVFAFDANQISAVETDLTGANPLGYSGRYETVDYPTTTLLYLGFNMTRSSPCREKALRQAVALAADRKEITARLLAGHAVAASLPVHPYVQGYDGETAALWEWDLERAAQVLEEGGIPLNESGQRLLARTPVALRLLVNQDNSYKVAVAETLAAGLESLGCTVTLEKLPWESFVTALERREFDLYLGETTLAADFGLESLLASGGSLNYGGFYDRELEGLMAACRAASGEDRTAAEGELCRAVAAAAPIVPLCFKNGSLLTQWGQVSGARPTQRNVYADIENWQVLGQ